MSIEEYSRLMCSVKKTADFRDVPGIADVELESSELRTLVNLPWMHIPNTNVVSEPRSTVAMWARDALQHVDEKLRAR
ncbi:hypothetical protein [Phyllobacterium brassicacearum]|uniref:hypothetical protein n=1 Tax=Phyllobacterium brassicacearum TaxID=314235 RepID=UPI0010D591A4|nr:hypothetical protein [Phyllobacterium brassicacearum]TDQ16196.1 hypothetical protein DEV91_13327 [Phyllobacterium brassicacearum]